MTEDESQPAYVVYKIGGRGELELAESEEYLLLIKGDRFSVVGLGAYASALQSILDAMYDRLNDEEVEEYRSKIEDLFEKLYKWEGESYDERY